jgi:hypothetical protein
MLKLSRQICVSVETVPRSGQHRVRIDLLVNPQVLHAREISLVISGALGAFLSGVSAG